MEQAESLGSSRGRWLLAISTRTTEQSGLAPGQPLTIFIPPPLVLSARQLYSVVSLYFHLFRVPISAAGRNPAVKGYISSLPRWRKPFNYSPRKRKGTTDGNEHPVHSSGSFLRYLCSLFLSFFPYIVPSFLSSFRSIPFSRLRKNSKFRIRERRSPDSPPFVSRHTFVGPSITSLLLKSFLDSGKLPRRTGSCRCVAQVTTSGNSERAGAGRPY